MLINMRSNYTAAYVRAGEVLAELLVRCRSTLFPSVCCDSQ